MRRVAASVPRHSGVNGDDYNDNEQLDFIICFSICFVLVFSANNDLFYFAFSGTWSETRGCKSTGTTTTQLQRRDGFNTNSTVVPVLIEINVFYRTTTYAKKPKGTLESECRMWTRLVSPALVHEKKKGTPKLWAKFDIRSLF